MTRDWLPGLDRRIARRALVAVGIGLAGELAALGLLATGAWLLLSASLRPPILLLSIAMGAVQVFSFLRGTARYVERLASHNLGLGLQAGLRAWLYHRLAQLVPCGLPGGDRGDLLTRLIDDTEEVQDLVVRAAVPVLAAAAAWGTAVVTAAALLSPAGPPGRRGPRRSGHRPHRGSGRTEGSGASGRPGRRRLLGPRRPHRPGGTGRPRSRGMGPGPARRA
jgi:ABC-type transport system involved in cytochrome bd biosynthesis fused ATPase/permease subunit